MIVHLQNKMVRNYNQMPYFQKPKLWTASTALAVQWPPYEQRWYEPSRDLQVDGKEKIA